MARFSEDTLNKVTAINIIDYAINNGLPVYRKSSSIKLEGFGGLCIKADGSQWNCFSDDSENAKGGIIQFVQYMEKLDFRKAVEKLMDYANIHQEPCDQAILLIHQAKNAEKESDQFELPKRSENYRRLYAYLSKTREIDKGIIDYYVKHHKIYEDERHNVVFCGGDREGQIRSASLRGTFTKPDRPAFKGLVQKSDKRFPFGFEGKSDKVFVFEAPIDLMSYQTLEKEYGNRKGRTTDHYIALNGVAHIGLTHYLKEHAEIKQIIFCLDNDEAGIQNTANLIDTIESWNRDYTFGIKVPSLKDWNEDLVALHAAEQEQNIDYGIEA